MSYIGKTPEAIGGIPLMTPIWYPSRAYLPAGYVPLDGQTVLRALYPDATQEVLNGRVPVVSEAAWATATNRGSYTTGDGSTTIRLPDFNGKSAGSLGAVFTRGDGTNSAGTNGVIQLDALKAHTHTQQVDNTANVVAGLAPKGTSPQNTPTTPSTANVTTGSTGDVETRPLNVTGCWAVKLFGVVTAQAILDTQAVVSTVNTLWGRRTLLLAAKATTSGNSASFSPADSTGIPSWAETVKVMLDQVSTNGGGYVSIRLGTSAGTVVSGYTTSIVVINSGTNQTTSTTDIPAGWNADMAGYSRTGEVTFTRHSGNIWTYSGQVMYDATSGGATMITGRVSLPGVLDRVIVATGGTFDAGSVSVRAES